MDIIMKYLNILIIITLLSTTIKSEENTQPSPKAMAGTASVETFNVPKNNIKRAIVLGATSGMGRQVAKILCKKGYIVGAAGRRTELLESLKQETNNKPSSRLRSTGKIITKQIDVTKHKDCRKKIIELIEELGGLDLIIITIGGWTNKSETSWEYNKQLIEIDTIGFFVAADVAIEFFKSQGHGHIAGISSIDGIRGNALWPVYSAVKAFISTYLEGIRNYMIQNKIPITVTEIIPGWVNNETFQFDQMNNTYWVSTTNKAAEQIVQAIEKKKKKAYITKRWVVIAKILKWLPDKIYNAPWWKIRSPKII